MQTLHPQQMNDVIDHVRLSLTDPDLFLVPKKMCVASFNREEVVGLKI